MILLPTASAQESEASSEPSQTVVCEHHPIVLRSEIPDHCSPSLLCSRLRTETAIEGACTRIEVALDHGDNGEVRASMHCERTVGHADRIMSAPTCEGLLDDVGLVIDLWLFEESATPPEEIPEHPIEVSAVEPPTIEPATIEAPIGPADAEPAIAVEAAVRGSWGAVSSIGLGLFAAPSLSWREFRLGLDLVYESSPGAILVHNASFWLSSLRIGPSLAYRFRDFETAAFVRGGSYWALYTPNSQLQSTWSAEVGIRVHQNFVIDQTLAGTIAVEIALPLMRIALLREDQVVFRTEPIFVALHFGFLIM